MNPQNVFCPNIEWPTKGQRDEGNTKVHSQADERYVSTVCNRTFTTKKGTLFYGLKTDSITVMRVVTLVANGCPTPAAAKAFELDQRTIRK